MSWKSEIITEINEGKKDALDHEIDSLCKVGKKVLYVLNDAGNLTTYTSKIKEINGNNVVLEDGHEADIHLIKLYIMNELLG